MNHETPGLTPQQVDNLTSEAMSPKKTSDFVMLKDKRIPIAFMPVEKEERVLELAAPLIPRIMGMADDPSRPGHVSPLAFAGLLPEAMKLLPQAVAIIAEPHADLDWIRSNCSTLELIPVVAAQIQKYGLQDALGKLSGLSGLLKKIKLES